MQQDSLISRCYRTDVAMLICLSAISTSSCIRKIQRSHATTHSSCTQHRWAITWMLQNSYWWPLLSRSVFHSVVGSIRF